MDQRLLVSICFFLSGAAALIYEVVWSKMLTTIFGASLYAVATTMAVFLGGLAVGAFIAGKLLEPTVSTKKRLWIYCAIETGIALFGGLIVPLCLPSDWLPNAYANLDASVGAAAALSYLLRFLITSIIILPPTILMGATLPILVGAYVRDTEKHDSATQALYAANTAGGAAGAIAAGFGLVPAVGLIESSIIAAILNGICALGVATATQLSAIPEPPPPQKKTAQAPPLLAKNSTIAIVAFLSGLILLQLEVCWTRWFALILGSSVYSFSLVLGTFLLSLAVGAWLVQRLLQRLGNGLLLISTALFLSATYILITLYSANELPWTLIQLSQAFGSTFASSLYARGTLIAIILGPPAMLLGTILPLLLGANVDHKQSFVGRVYAMNVAGAICGALITGFALIPGLSALADTGIRWTLILNICVQMIACCWLFMEWARQFVTDPDTRGIVVGIVIFVSAAMIIDVALFRPEWNKAIASAGASFFTPEDLKKLDKETFLAAIGALEGQQDNMRFYREGLNATVTVAQDTRRNVVYLKTDGKVEAAVAISPLQPSRGSDVTTHQLLGTLPSHLVSAPTATALVIGYGSGTTSGAVISNPAILQLTIAELESAVFAADKFFRQSNGAPLQQAGRVRAITNDGRYVLLASRSAYDVIVCQPSDPWVTGSSELFTQDFWQLAKAHLKPNGVISQWLQLYSISPRDFTRLVKTFAQVFPNCAIILPQHAGECVLIGSTSSSPLTRAQIMQAGNSLGTIIQDAAIVEPAGVQSIASSSDVRVNSDDHNVIEYAAAEAAMTQRQNITDNAQILTKAATLSR